MFGDDNNAPPPYVPPGALVKPAGAVVDEHGLVACVTCGARIPLSSADVVGMGYRCTRCTHRAEIGQLTGAGDAASHFTAGERKEIANSALITIAGGVGAMLLGIVLFALWFRRIGIACVVGGIAMIGLGFARRDAAY